MKNIFYDKKVVFFTGLIAGAVLMLIFSFAIPGRRTYIGGEEGMGLRQVEEFEEEIIVSKKTDDEEKAVLKDIEEKAGISYKGYKRFYSAKRPEEEVDTAGEIDLGKGTPGKVEAEHIEVKETKEYPMIPHDNIPLGGVYKMKE